MTAQQSADVMMFRNLSQFLAQNGAILNKSANLKEDASDFQNALTQLEAKIQEVNTVSEITGQEKLQLRNELIQETIRYMSILYRHALKSNNAPLLKISEVKLSDLKKLTDADFISYCNQAAEIFTNHSVVFHTALISTQEQKHLLDKIQDFKTVKPQVKLNRTRKTVQNEDIEQHIKTIKNLLKKMLDASVLSVQGSDAEFVRQYEMNRERREPTKSNSKSNPVKKD
jgi:hypothetical protein